ncbi:MAG: rhodanese-like domain-containing protein [Candidatus Dadabacteria bacterium]
MKSYKLFLILILFVFTKVSVGQSPENWTSKQLMQPADLATTINTGKNIPTIISVGPAALIPGSISIGMTKNQANVDKLKKQLAILPKTSNVVIYCGCCPFEHCPNVRPAITALKELKFKNYYLLNLPRNIKADWIDKGYPTVKN